MFSKACLLRSKAYRQWVASQECFGCGVEGYSQCAHEEAGKGLALKSDDRRSFPLCCTRMGIVGCHFEHTMLIGMTRDDRRELEAIYVEKMQARARAAGRPEFK
jgi:hypothetical protein